MTAGAPTLEELAILARFARGATLREVARALGADRSTLSRRLAAIEERLGSAIFLRRGKQLVPTRFGGLLLEKALAATRALDEVQALADAGSDQTVVVAMAPLLAEVLLPDAAAALAARAPALRLAVELSHEYQELYDERIDVALRRGPLPDSDSLQSRRLGATTMVVVAAREAARGAGEPDDRAAALPWIRVGAGLAPVAVKRPGRREAALVVPRYAVDSQRAALALVRRGLGVARLNAFFVRDALDRGELVEWLPEARSREGVYAVWARRRTPVPAVRAVVQALAEASAAAGIFDA